MYSNDEIINKIFNGDTREVLSNFPDACIDECITSIPYYLMRTYGLGVKELGQEKSIFVYLSRMSDVFNEVKRVLKPRGTCWVNVGDSYDNGFLRGTPHLFSSTMGNCGWRKFNEIIWHKPNVFTSSSKKRFTQDFEYLFAFAKQEDYYFEQQYEPYKTVYKSFKYTGVGKKDYKKDGAQDPSDAKRSILSSMEKGLGRHKRCVWTIPHKTSKHTATFPRALVEPAIRAGCPRGGIVLDPFCGSGIALRVAGENSRNYCGIDLDPKCVEMSTKLVNCSC